jgi:hypothetical protein
MIALKTLEMLLKSYFFLGKLAIQISFFHFQLIIIKNLFFNFHLLYCLHSIRQPLTKDNWIFLFRRVRHPLTLATFSMLNSRVRSFLVEVFYQVSVSFLFLIFYEYIFRFFENFLSLDGF